MNSEIREMKFDAWRHGLLDISKRNRLMNYRKSKRATLQITLPAMPDLYRKLVTEGDSLSFRKQIDAGDDLHLTQLFYIMDRMDASVELAEGEVASNLSTAEMNQTLRNLRSKAKLSQEEQGINILYLSFGFLQWRQKFGDSPILSPLVLVPVSLEIESILSPFRMRRFEEDIVVNPTLDYALSSEYGITLPDFDPSADEIGAFLDRIDALVSKNGWSVIKEANLGLLSFLKIVMYKDLEKYRDRIFSNPVVQAFCGDSSALPPIDGGPRPFSHDDIPAMDTCQVVNADASQQDAILLSRNGASFVLQGPPGTGKSQTITNIIAQALADRKKVLFVSEKMAALSVVYRRLEEAGLADFCLSLHNYRAERRAVIQDLVSTLDAPTKSVRAGVTDALAVLEEDRAQLNRYVSEMSKLRVPLNRTIFEVITELVSEEDLGFFRIAEDTARTTEKEFAARVSLLRSLSDFLENYDGNIYENPWRGSSMAMVTYEVRNTVSTQLCSLVGYLLGLSGTLSYLDRKYGPQRQWTLNEYELLLQKTVHAFLISKVEETLDTQAGDAVFASNSLETLESAYRKLIDAYNAAIGNGIAEELLANPEIMEQARDTLAEHRDHLDQADSLIQAVHRAVSVRFPENRVGLMQARSLLRVLSIRHPVLQAWFRDDQFDSIKKQIREWKELSDKVNALKEQIDASWNAEFYRLDFRRLISKFTGDYKSFFKRLGAEYKSDKNAMISARKGHPSRLDDRECAAGLHLLRDYREALDQYSHAAEKAADILGQYDRGTDTDWDELIRIFNECETAQSYFRQYGISDVVLMHLEKTYSERTKAILPSLNAISVESAVGALDDAIAAAADKEKTFAAQARITDKQILSLEAVSDAFSLCKHAAASFMTPDMPAPASTEELLHLFEALTGMIRRAHETKQSLEIYFANDQWPVPRDVMPELMELFEERIDTEALTSYAAQLREHYSSLQAEAFCGCIAHACDSIRVPEQESILRTYSGWFPALDCRSVPLQALSDQISQCRDIESLQSWLRFAGIHQKCSDHGMTDYLAFVERQHIAPREIVPVYRKSFLTKWLMDTLVLENVPDLQNFQSYAHEKIITDFKEKDSSQLRIAQARLIDKLSHEKPSGINRLASAMDEVTILRREAEKKRRITPLRRLFKTIPALLQKLKPCFMMSPLSVSYFLDSDMYHFDLVIFDEASQILPEDAVGAIYRGRQVIIAGDTRQMPPTSFFAAASRNTEDYDTDEDSDEYCPDIVSESVLDEAVACLPSCTLLWHYRSRDESLIAFSNRQLYNNSLITFPNCSRLEDRGLEYVYVPNGCYEGSGRNCNVTEAKKCLALVVEHIQKHPDRSLGIIAFSEKQQAVIEDVVSDFRLKNRQYEDFFDETRDEPFFVKNLENVQGDERDTIIFSICYAKNAQGKMYQRFGPLGQDGGERRLNVAITRAKYNVKLVGSILPTDIVVREGTKDGVRMLREYIYYAMQNDYGISPGNPAVDEPFSDQIAAFIESSGYRCRRNVGASAYKVDIAVEKPGYADVLMAGIECDGPHYANTRTARDRDVLRRDIMSSLGWRLYHVWSMAWYLNPAEEKKRLLDFLKQCGRADPEKQVLRAAAPGEETADRPDLAFGNVEDMTDTVDRSSDASQLTFDPYVYANPLDVPFESGEGDYTIIARFIMWVMEREQPIHKEELYRRLAAVLGSGKITAAVKKTVDDCINRRLSDRIIIRGDFLYLKGAPVVARAPEKNGEPRPIDHIAPEEIQDAMMKILRFACSLTAKDLISETARQLGYARTGPRINSILEENVGAMLASGKLRESDEKLYCTEEND